MQPSLYDQWTNEGYVVVPQLFAAERAANLRTICDRILEQWRITDPQTGETHDDPNVNCMRHLNHPAYFSGRHSDFVEIMGAASDPNVLAVGREILDEEPLFRCTSYFFNPLKDSQDGNWHRDTQFMHRDPEIEKKTLLERAMVEGVQMQVALVPSDDIEYVPGSHMRWDTPDEFNIRLADGERNSRSNHMPGALRLKLNAGDAVLFNPSGLHRGRYHTDKLRRTLMLTYTRTSKPHYDYFSNQPWFLEPGHLDGLDAKTKAFFEKYIEAYTADWRKDLQPAAV